MNEPPISGGVPPAGADSWWRRARRLVFGDPRSIHDPHVFHRISLVAFLAWVGLGADGLSSSSYGPEEMFKTLISPTLGDHTYLAVGLALAVAVTVFVISYAYSRIVEHFPFGGGGYVVASKLLGARFGVVSGSALLVDYVLTVTVSIAAGADAFYSFLPAHLHHGKLLAEFLVIVLLMLLNLRGVKESVTVLMPIFLGFLVTHAIVIAGTLALKGSAAPVIATEVHRDFVGKGLGTLGLFAMTALFLRAYCMGAGTYTGIEAVSNGLQIMREPKVATAQKTMRLMAASLALTAGGITLCYLLLHAVPDPEGPGHRTMNAILTRNFLDLAHVPRLPGDLFFWLTMGAEAALLFVAAQAGFIDGPRVMANMATDSWLPHRFAQLSDRLTMQYGVLIITAASLLVLLATGGQTDTLVLMYSINVFLTFSLSESGMVRYWIRHRKRYPDWSRHIVIHVIGLCMCATILVVNVIVKFTEGGWITLAVTSLLIGVCMLIRKHYRTVQSNLRRLDVSLDALPRLHEPEPKKLDATKPTAVLLVGAYGGLGIHTMLTVQRLFPGHYKNWMFVSIGVIDSATFKGVEEVEEVREKTQRSLDRYVALARGLGLAADSRMDMGTEAVEVAEALCRRIAEEYPQSIFFAGKLIFQQERWYQRLLHNETAYALQRRLQFAGLNAMVLPVRVLEAAA